MATIVYQPRAAHVARYCVAITDALLRHTVSGRAPSGTASLQSHFADSAHNRTVGRRDPYLWSMGISIIRIWSHATPAPTF